MDKIKNYLKNNNFNYSVLTYEELNSIDVISYAIETDEWKKYADFNSLPIGIDKDYKKLIHNYDEVKQLLIDSGAL